MNFKTLFILTLTLNYSIAQRPISRNSVNITYDEKNEQVVVFGGSIGNGQISTDLWTLKAGEWKKISDDGPKRIKCAFVYDPYRHRIVLFGGVDESDVKFGETWEWDGKQWEQISIAGPSARNHPMGVYDRKNKYVLIFGGSANGRQSDTWAYDGTIWKKMDDNGPKNCLPQGLIYDEVREKIIMITMDLSPDSTARMHKNEMWEWTGNSWMKLLYPTPSTSITGLQGLASFSKEEIVLFDGDAVSNNKGKTWKFSNGQWTGASLPGPSAPRTAEGMIHDKSRKRTILFGGSNRTRNFNDLWEWDGTQWHDLTEEWLRTHPNDEEAWQTYAVSLNSRGKYSEAEEVYKNLLNKDPNNAKVLIEIVLLMYKVSKPDEAENYMSRIAKSDELNKSDYLNLGSSLYTLKKYKESIKYYEEAVKFNPSGGDFYNLACSCALGGEKDKAFESLTKAIEKGFNSKRQYENDPDLESLKSDDRWKVLLETLK